MMPKPAPVKNCETMLWFTVLSPAVMVEARIARAMPRTVHAQMHVAFLIAWHSQPSAWQWSFKIAEWACLPCVRCMRMCRHACVRAHHAKCVHTLTRHGCTDQCIASGW